MRSDGENDSESKGNGGAILYEANSRETPLDPHEVELLELLHPFSKWESVKPPAP